MKLAEKQKSESKNAQIQNWVNNIAEETSDTSPPPDDESADVIPPVSSKSNIGGQPKVGPPKTKTKYTTHGRRTSSMSGIDIQKTSKMNLSSLPQPADLSLPVGDGSNLKKPPKKAAPLVADQSNANAKVKDWKATESEEKDWTIIDLQNGIGSEGSSFEHIERLDDIELELGFEQVET